MSGSEAPGLTGWHHVGGQRKAQQRNTCHLPSRLVKVSSRLEGSAVGTASSETLPNQVLLSSPYWCSMAVPEDPLTTSNPLKSLPIVGAPSSSTTSWAVVTQTSPTTPRCGELSCSWKSLPQCAKSWDSTTSISLATLGEGCSPWSTLSPSRWAWPASSSPARRPAYPSG